MEIKSVFDKAFASYGQIHTGYALENLMGAMAAISLPEQGTDYRPSIPKLEAADCFRALEDRAFGGLPIQVGMCWGRNTRLNCLEYHLSSEFNLGWIRIRWRLSACLPAPWWRSTPPACTMPPAMWMQQRASGWRWCCPGAPTRKRRS